MTTLIFLDPFDNPKTKRCRICLRGKYGVRDGWICGKCYDKNYNPYVSRLK